ncbi:MAG: hypothetical protein ABL896_15485, partial [Hylemonella sp.]
ARPSRGFSGETLRGALLAGEARDMALDKKTNGRAILHEKTRPSIHHRLAPTKKPAEAGFSWISA